VRCLSRSNLCLKLQKVDKGEGLRNKIQKLWGSFETYSELRLRQNNGYHYHFYAGSNSANYSIPVKESVVFLQLLGKFEYESYLPQRTSPAEHYMDCLEMVVGTEKKKKL